MTTLKLTEQQRKVLVSLLAVTDGEMTDARRNGWQSEAFGDPLTKSDFDFTLDELYEALLEA
jgi:hypothetical protein